MGKVIEHFDGRPKARVYRDSEGWHLRMADGSGCSLSGAPHSEWPLKDNDVNPPDSVLWFAIGLAVATLLDTGEKIPEIEVIR